MCLFSKRFLKSHLRFTATLSIEFPDITLTLRCTTFPLSTSYTRLQFFQTDESPWFTLRFILRVVCYRFWQMCNGTDPLLFTKKRFDCSRSLRCACLSQNLLSPSSDDLVSGFVPHILSHQSAPHGSQPFHRASSHKNMHFKSFHGLMV